MYMSFHHSPSKEQLDYRLYLVTDSDCLTGNSLESAVEQAILGGCTLVQLREKAGSSLEFYQIGLRIKAITEQYQMPLIINDRVDIMLALDAQGVHVGQSDLPVAAVRKLVGPKKIIGTSVTNVKEAQEAVQAGADYLGVGAMFSTDTKTDAKPVSISELKRITQTFKQPAVAIGGIQKQTIPAFSGINIAGIAVVSAILAQENPREAAAELKAEIVQTMGWSHG